MMNTPNLQVHGDSAEDILLDSTSTEIRGVTSGKGDKFEASKVIITTGTFLRGVIHLGLDRYAAGRHVRDSEEVEPPSVGLAATLERLVLHPARTACSALCYSHLLSLLSSPLFTHLIVFVHMPFLCVSHDSLHFHPLTTNRAQRGLRHSAVSSDSSSSLSCAYTSASRAPFLAGFPYGQAHHRHPSTCGWAHLGLLFHGCAAE